MAGFTVQCIENHSHYMLVPLYPSPGVIQYQTDFLDNLWYALNSGTGNDDESPGTTNHPGIIELSTGTTATSFYSMFLNNGPSSSTCVIDADDSFASEYIFQTGATLTGAQYNVGLFGDTDNVDADHMIFVEYVQGMDTNWQFITRDSTGEGFQTKTDSGVAVSADTWYRLLIYRNGSNIEFKMATGAGDYGTATSHSTDITGIDVCPTFYVQTSDTTSNILNVDAFYVYILGVSR